MMEQVKPQHSLSRVRPVLVMYGAEVCCPLEVIFFSLTAARKRGTVSFRCVLGDKDISPLLLLKGPLSTALLPQRKAGWMARLVTLCTMKWKELIRKGPVKYMNHKVTPAHPRSPRRCWLRNVWKHCICTDW